jgi:hypothetical protein
MNRKSRASCVPNFKSRSLSRVVDQLLLRRLQLRGSRAELLVGSRRWDRVCAIACRLPMRFSVRESGVKTFLNGRETNTKFFTITP